MAAEVQIPVWVLVLAWSVGGYAVAVKLQGAVMRADLVGRPSLARKVIDLPAVLKYGVLALAVLVTGPLVWIEVARESLGELGRFVVARVKRWWTNRKAARDAN
jgi:hypothetical protein